MFTIKTYSLSGDLIKTISPRDVMGDISWSSQINGWQWEIRVRLSGYIGTFIDGEILRVFVTNEYYPSGKCVYTGVITKTVYEYWKNEYTEIVALGLHVLFGFKLHPNGTKSGTVSSILSDIIDVMNTSYGNIFTKDIEATSNTASINLEYQNVSSALSKISVDGYSWNIDWEGKFIWKQNSLQAVHRLSLGWTIEKMTSSFDREEMRNRVIVKYSSGVTTSEDLSSISESFLREEYIENTDITTLWYSQTFWNSKLQDSKPTMKISVSSYDIYSILPGHFIRILNTNLPIENISHVFRINYRKDGADIELWNITSIAEALRT